uniref:NcyJ n=1 Tax=Nannocystis sp. MB1016 TaxID=1696011 RepID=A0A0M4KQF4_9BACT|nr:NcyJ [Nannocystis sp. MB1016]
MLSSLGTADNQERIFYNAAGARRSSSSSSART